MKQPVRSYRDLVVWQRAMDFVEQIYALTTDFPRQERFNLTDQLRRAAVSIPANIAEGHGQSPAVFARHLNIALGSAAELDTLLELARRLALFSPQQWEALAQELVTIRKMLFGLRRSLQSPS
ncbi:MAG: four helix bundle protein [Chloroflexi bacterium]|nr:four helix bundle protein [Chloroflexota bacterium]